MHSMESSEILICLAIILLFGSLVLVIIVITSHTILTLQLYDIVQIEHLRAMRDQ